MLLMFLNIFNVVQMFLGNVDFLVCFYMISDSLMNVLKCFSLLFKFWNTFAEDISLDRVRQAMLWGSILQKPL